MAVNSTCNKIELMDVLALSADKLPYLTFYVLLLLSRQYMLHEQYASDLCTIAPFKQRVS